jgi:hypothetical protein
VTDNEQEDPHSQCYVIGPPELPVVAQGRRSATPALTVGVGG